MNNIHSSWDWHYGIDFKFAYLKILLFTSTLLLCHPLFCYVVVGLFIYIIYYWITNYMVPKFNIHIFILQYNRG